MVELRENPDKNHIEIKFGTEVKEHVRNDQKKSPIDWTLGKPFWAHFQNGRFRPNHQNFDVIKIISITYRWKDNLMLSRKFA